jgi:phospholipid/cholesterol/gamma-HCH transport system permease protein
MDWLGCRRGDGADATARSFAPSNGRIDEVKTAIKPASVAISLGPMQRWLDEVGRATLLGVAILRVLPRPSRYARAVVQHGYVMGIRSLPLVLIMAALGGAVTSQQTGAQFTGSLPLWVIGSVAAASVLTELGPLLTGLVLVGRVGASIAAELATMKVTEQIDALQAMGRDPVTHLVVPRVLAGVLVMPPLVILANFTALLTAWIVGILAVDGLTTADFLYGMRFYFRPFTLTFSVIKGVAFGLCITFLACYIGMNGRGGAQGVGRTTTAAVVATTLGLMILDVILVPLLKTW